MRGSARAPPPLRISPGGAPPRPSCGGTALVPSDWLSLSRSRIRFRVRGAWSPQQPSALRAEASAWFPPAADLATRGESQSQANLSNTSLSSECPSFQRLEREGRLLVELQYWCDLFPERLHCGWGGGAQSPWLGNQKTWILALIRPLICCCDTLGQPL